MTRARRFDEQTHWDRDPGGVRAGGAGWAPPGADFFIDRADPYWGRVLDKARRAYGFDDVAIVPSRRTRDPDDVDITWTLGPYRFELPLLASAMDGVVSPEQAETILARYRPPSDRVSPGAGSTRRPGV